jgi:hypothetical protein
MSSFLEWLGLDTFRKRIFDDRKRMLAYHA